MSESEDGTRVEWREWGPEAFAEASERDVPVLVAVAAEWSESCRAMDERTYAEPRIAANVNDDFVPVRVDADRRPRVRERYNMGGFPSTVFVTPEGEHIAGATFLEPEGFRQVLQRVRETWDEKGEDAGSVPRALAGGEPPAAPVTGDVERLVAGQLGDQYDEEHAGWGTSEKFPLPETLSFALKRDRERALRTLDAVRRHLADDDGGFFRFAHARDWSDPQAEKTLSVNASLLAAFAHAYLHTGEDEYLDAADGVVDYLTGTLWTGEAFAASETPDGRIDETAYADGNALAAEALLTLASYTDDDRARRYAERTLDYLGEELVDGATVRHSAGEDAPTGLLADRARVVGAFAAAAQVLDPDYLDTARTVADAAIDDLQDATGAFTDGPQTGAGLLDQPLRPVDDTAAMADALVDLHHLTGDDRYLDSARDAVSAFAGAAERMGVQVAGYATAAARVADSPLVVRVADDPGSDLHRAALRMADHEKVVAADADGDPGTAWLETDEGATDVVDSPAALAELVADSR
ncbi:DUF255 domain-containing protein [Halobacterium jilantaiense]|uniref:Spermatogenesis-associated protein 20-like TRX domain-containing protein n=1 Tax=Halobacterium jilantaiense TaxID=355548 RepID=A0A1I0Q8X2_9EURY|nr:DUF255 domain-containing protein [Halobacterium jilantaiense]SEW23463.1 hypothetical protein SAMN04487945_2392 [Halobacterium jilantaiense]